MSRIRTVKPEWLDDEGLLRAGMGARVLSVALILLADDYGRGRCIDAVLAGQVFPFEAEPSRELRESLARLSAMGFVRVYTVRGQRYFELTNWTKHQKVDKPGKPRVPEPLDDTRENSRDIRESLAPDLDLDLDLSTTTTTVCESAHAREAALELEEVRRQNAANRQRPPVGEPPPNLPAPEPAADVQVWAAYEALAGPQGHPKLHRDSLDSLAAVCVAKAQQTKSTVRDVATALLSAWLADDYVRKNKPSIQNLAKNPGRYLPALPAPRPAVAKAKPLPLHPRLQQLKDAFDAKCDDRSLFIEDIAKLRDAYESQREQIEYELRKESHANAS